MHYLQQSFPKTAFSTSFILYNAETLDCNDIHILTYILTIFVNLKHYSLSEILDLFAENQKIKVIMFIRLDSR